MKKRLIYFLKRLEAAVPPPPNCHHVITYAQLGSNEAGWTDKLAVQVNRDGKFFCFFLDDGDLEKAPDGTVSVIVSLLDAPPAGAAQLGITLGQYIK